jgi:ABC-type molybdate transport system substrate-binding protein
LVLPLLVGFAQAQTPCPPGQAQLVVVQAGSVSAAFAAVAARYTQQTGVCVVDIAGGSVSAARQIASGRQPCDIFASADDAVIDRMLKPAGLADFSIRFAQGSMVLAYTADSKGADGLTPVGSEFKPPAAVPEVLGDWASRLSQPGVTIGGSHPFQDPGGYRADLIFQLAADRYRQPGLYNELLGRYAVSRPGDALGQRFDYPFTYAHSALAASKADRTGRYRYARLPTGLDLGGDGDDGRVGPRGITIPGLQVPGSATDGLSSQTASWTATLAAWPSTSGPPPPRPWSSTPASTACRRRATRVGSRMARRSTCPLRPTPRPRAWAWDSVTPGSICRTNWRRCA